MNSSVFQSLIRGASLLALAAGATQAQVFTYSNTSDALLTFRQSGTGSSANDLVVNLGSVSQFRTFSGTTFEVFSGSGLATAFNGTAGFGNLQVSVVSAIRSAALGLPAQTLFLTRERTALNTQTAPWTTRTSSSQGTIGGNIESIGNASVTLGSSTPSSVLANGVIEVPDSASGSPTGRIGSGNTGGGPLGNLRGTFASTGVSGASVEFTTPVGFTGVQTVRADFYELRPAASLNAGVPATYLGYFELSGNGSVSFTAVPEPSEYAALGGAGLVAFALWRRNRAAR
jgi:hypothetical protein